MFFLIGMCTQLKTPGTYAWTNSTAQFMELLKPEAEDQAKAPQKNLENLFVKESVTKTNRPFVNKIPEEDR